MDNNLWQRRSNSGRLSLSTSNSLSNSNSNTKAETRPSYSRAFPSAKRFGPDSASGGKTNPFNNIAPLSANSTTTPTTGASSAFGLGSGAFASFGSTNKTPRTPGTALDFGNDKANTPTSGGKGNISRAEDKSLPNKASISSLASTNDQSVTTSTNSSSSEHPLKTTWVVWYRPPTTIKSARHTDYEKSTIQIVCFSTVEQFWAIYSHLKRPSTLPTVSDYHIFKQGIRPVWEDEENKRGGKWIVRLKKGVADRYWENLLLIMIGDQFAEAGEEVCGAVLSVRSGEDVLSVWTKIDGGRNIKIRETIKRLLEFPADTNIVWKSHDDSIAQRSAIEHSRQEKGNTAGSHYHNKRRDTLGGVPPGYTNPSATSAGQGHQEFSKDL